MASDLRQLAEKYQELRDKKRLKEAELDDLKMEMEQVEQAMIPLMEALETQNIKFEGIGTVYLKTNFYAAVVKGKEEDFVRWLDSKGLGDLASRKIHAATLKSEYQKWMDEDRPIPPTELVTAYPKTTVHINKSAAKSK